MDLSKPFIESDTTATWAALNKWDFDFFSNNYGETKVTVSNADFTELYEVKISDYINYIQNSSKEDEDKLYLRDWSFEEDCPEISNDYVEPDYCEDIFEGFDERIFPKSKWLYLGAEGTGTGLHQDLLNTHSWNSLLVGEKEWIFYSPTDTDFLYNGQVDAFNMDFEKYPLLSRANPIRIVQKEGDTVFIPSGWWHQVRNNTATIAITKNFVSRDTLEGFLLENLNLKGGER
ncbi:TPA: cupin-like domain-containing protein [Streptococcus suis]